MNWLEKFIVKISTLFFSSYTERKGLFNGNSPCYCESNKKYSKCCKPINDSNNKVAIKIVKTYSKGDRRVVKIKVIGKDSRYIKSFKPGDINPLNSEGKYKEIGIGSD